MGEALDKSALARWQKEPTRFITETMRDPESGHAFKLLPAERAFMAHCFRTNEAGRLIHPEWVFATPKKFGKTTFSAMLMLTTTLVYGGRFAEGYTLANDLEQSRGRVFEAVRRIVEGSPYLDGEANIKQGRIEFPATGATIQAIAADYAGAAGANPTISCFDELWAYTSERSWRLWDEMVPSPARKISCRLTTTYAGFEGESELLEGLYKRGLAQQQIGADLHAGGNLLMFWTHEPQAPWQTPEWIEEMRHSLRPNQFLRMIENRFVTSEETFVEMAWWDACVTGRPVVADGTLVVYVGVDASVKRDSTGIAACAWDKATKRVRLITHRIFRPSPDNPLDFESTIENTILELRHRFQVREVRYDPYQMQSTAQRLQRQGVPMVEFPQTVPNLTAASQNLYELIKSGGLSVYDDPDIRLAVQRSVAVETTRGWRIAKEKQSHKIDIVVALAMAAHAAVQKGEAGFLHVGHMQGPGGGKITWKDEEPNYLTVKYVTRDDSGEVVRETLSHRPRDRRWAIGGRRR